MLLKLEGNNGYAAFPVGTTKDDAEALVNPGKKRVVKISGLIVLGVIVAITILLMTLNERSIAPVAPIGVLIFGLALMHFYNASVELFGKRFLHRRLRRHEAAGKLVWVPVGLKVYVDLICQRNGMAAAPPEVFSYDMPAARKTATAYRRLSRREKRQLSEQLRQQIAALIDGAVAS